ncbi:MAG TPA: purine-nucleoside phosphorylase [Isosphaeraceae bacterium]|jgi:purine-nucleoside phosphorylase
MELLALYDRAVAAAAAIRAVVDEVPRVAVVLGSGLGAIAESLTGPTVLPYGRIPHFPAPTVAGHAGRLVVGTLGRHEVVVLQGRFHGYEGHDLGTVTFPIRVLQALGVRTLVLTAAAGGVNVNRHPGDLVGLTDHLNLIGANPLRGPHDERLGARFPDLGEVYSARVRRWAVEEAHRLGFVLHLGVYAALPGPSYETPAEVRMLRILGADVVGMSTVPEAIVARQAGMEVLGLAVVTNRAAGLAPTPLSHAEVLEIGRAAAARLGALISRVVERIAADTPGA